MKVKLSWIHMISYDFVIQAQPPASLGQLAGNSKTFLMNLGWLFGLKKSPHQGNFYLVSSFIGTAGWNFSNKTNHEHLAFLQTFIIFNAKKKKFVFRSHYFLWKKIKKILQDQKGKKIQTFSVAYKIHLLITFRHFFGFVWTATASVLTGYLRLLCALNFLPFIAETLWVWFSKDKAKNTLLLVIISQVF